jgi:hypothetical protein
MPAYNLQEQKMSLKHLNSAQKENIHTMHLIMKNNYTQFDSEVAGVFSGALNRPKNI